MAKVLRAELSVGEHRSRGDRNSIPDTSAAGRLLACGLIVLNPPWTLACELRILLPELAAALSEGGGGAHRLDWLASEK